MTCGIVSEVFYLTELGTDAWKNCPLLDGNSPSGAREELVLSLGKEHEDVLSKSKIVGKKKSQVCKTQVLFKPHFAFRSYTKRRRRSRLQSQAGVSYQRKVEPGLVGLVLHHVARVLRHPAM